MPFHLIVTLRVRERVTRIDNLELPLLAELELLGDERETQSGSARHAVSRNDHRRRASRRADRHRAGDAASDRRARR